MTDREILELMKANDSRGLDELIKAYKGSVERVVSRIVVNRADCEEAVQDTFYKVWKNRESIDLEKRSLKGYVNMVAAGCGVDKLRSSSSTDYDTLSAEENDIGVEVDYADQTARAINMKVIAECIRDMKSPDREIFIDRYYYRLSVKEIAKRHRVKDKKVENILSRRKERLRKALLKKGVIL